MTGVVIDVMTTDVMTDADGAATIATSVVVMKVVATTGDDVTQTAMAAAVVAGVVLEMTEVCGYAV